MCTHYILVSTPVMALGGLRETALQTHTHTQRYKRGFPPPPPDTRTFLISAQTYSLSHRGRQENTYVQSSHTNTVTHAHLMAKMSCYRTHCHTNKYFPAERSGAGRKGWGGFEVSTLCLGFNLILKSF